MTETEWVLCNDPRSLLAALQAEVSRRKLRCFVCAACRRNQANIGKDIFRDALEVSERFATGSASEDELAQVSSSTGLQCFKRVSMVQGHAQTMIHWATQPDESMVSAAHVVLARKASAQQWQANILRDIFGNPFRSVSAEPSWLTSTVVALATGIYEERAFDQMPILADALQDAGCDNKHILTHCRQPGEHVRGCWVVDLILGKS
jgi:hypothetical protein